MNEKICVLRIKQKFFNISLIAVHVLTKEKAEENKDTFCDNFGNRKLQCQHW